MESRVLPIGLILKMSSFPKTMITRGIDFPFGIVSNNDMRGDCFLQRKHQLKITKTSRKLAHSNFIVRAVQYWEFLHSTAEIDTFKRLKRLKRNWNKPFLVFLDYKWHPWTTSRTHETAGTNFWKQKTKKFGKTRKQKILQAGTPKLFNPIFYEGKTWVTNGLSTWLG